MRVKMKNKILEKLIFEGFGFPVVLHNVIIRHYEGEAFPDINYNELKLQTIKALIISPNAINGAQLKFLRKFVNKSLRDLGAELEVSHAQIKNWEDADHSFTGLTQNQERKLKSLVLNHLLSQEQKYFYDRLLNQDIKYDSENGPFDPFEYV